SPAEDDEGDKGICGEDREREKEIGAASGKAREARDERGFKSFQGRFLIGCIRDGERSGKAPEGPRTPEGLEKANEKDDDGRNRPNGRGLWALGARVSRIDANRGRELNAERLLDKELDPPEFIAVSRTERGVGLPRGRPRFGVSGKRRVHDDEALRSAPCK